MQSYYEGISRSSKTLLTIWMKNVTHSNFILFDLHEMFTMVPNTRLSLIHNIGDLKQNINCKFYLHLFFLAKYKMSMETSSFLVTWIEI